MLGRVDVMHVREILAVRCLCMIGGDGRLWWELLVRGKDVQMGGFRGFMRGLGGWWGG